MLLENRIYLQQLAAAVNHIDGIEEISQSAVLVTGAGGMLGSCIVDVLLYLNEHCGFHTQIYAAGRNAGNMRRRFDGYYNRSYFHVITWDVSGEQSPDLPVDYVIHAAGNADPFRFANDPVGTLLANVIGVKHVLELAGACHGKRVLYVSSGEMYGQTDDRAADGFCEDYCGFVDYGDARSCYPAGKRAAEVLCQSYIRQFGLDVVIVRPCHCYGPTMTDTDSRVLSQFLRKAFRGEELVLKSAGEVVRSHCYAVDAAAGILMVLLKGRCGEAYNIADPDSVASIREAAEVIASESGQKVRFAVPDDTEKQGFSRVNRAVLNSTKIFSLGWRPLFDLHRGVADTLNILSEI